MSWRRFDSLFARLLLLQVLVAIALLLVFGGLIYVERNVAVARLVAERWAPELRRAAGWPGEVPALPREPLRRAERPPNALVSSLSTPRMTALDAQLRRLGVPLQEEALARGAGGPVLWLRLRTPDGGSAWFGLVDDALLPNVPGRFLLAVLIAALLLAGVSWVFTRRLTRPLELLRTRMQSHRPGEPTTTSVPIESASPEVAAIEAAYAELLQRYERHERERALLLAGVSHDLRSPLARIRMAAGLLPERAESATWREAIVRNTQVADRLIESFLDHVRAGELALDQSADLAVLARSAATATGRGGDELAVVAPPKLTLQRTHPLLVERLLANLLDNAFKHGRAPVELRVHSRGERAVVEVEDGGTGVPDDQRAHVLQAFARGDAARGTPGTGLGLAIVVRVLARMGGSLAFDQRDGRHVVRVELPTDP
jgi:two-component system, OmpR family, osmolarity sensor histidine kinase EnvZ